MRMVGNNLDRDKNPLQHQLPPKSYTPALAVIYPFIHYAMLRMFFLDTVERYDR